MEKIELSIEKIISEVKTVFDTTYMTHHGPIMSHDVFDKMPRFGSPLLLEEL